VDLKDGIARLYRWLIEHRAPLRAPLSLIKDPPDDAPHDDPLAVPEVAALWRGGRAL
jgi:hypothetical protein